LRKNSDNLILSDSTSPIAIFEKPRKYTDNVYEIRRKRRKSKPKKVNDNEKSTTIEGTSVITPLMQSRKDSGFEGFVSSNTSTPTITKIKL